MVIVATENANKDNNNNNNSNSNTITSTPTSTTSIEEKESVKSNARNKPSRNSVEVFFSSILPSSNRASSPTALSITDPTIINPNPLTNSTNSDTDSNSNSNSSNNSTPVSSPIKTHSHNINEQHSYTPTTPTTTTTTTTAAISGGSAFSPLSDVFAKISNFASSSTLLPPTPTKHNSMNGGLNTTTTTTNTFWKKQPAKVPGTVKLMKSLPPRFETNQDSNPGSPSIATYIPRYSSPNIPTPDTQNSTTNSEDASNESTSTTSSTDSLSAPNNNNNTNTKKANNRNSQITSLIDAEPNDVIRIMENPDGSHSPNERLSRLNKFLRLLESPIIDIERLKKLSWKGVPPEVRPITWKILLGYVPTNMDRRETALERKRKEYHDCIPQYMVSENERTDYEDKIYKQIVIDIPRTNPTVPLFQQPLVQSILERVLYIWAIRHPASGYVQGINDLATPFFIVFLSEYVDKVEECSVSDLDPNVLGMVEADSYWCLSKLLDGIQDHYTFAQPGLQRMIYKLKELVSRIDSPLARHLEAQDAQYLQFAFRWMNCLLMRELPLPLVIRMWDTYLGEGAAQGFGVFHVYVCAAFLVMWSEELRKRDFQEIMLFLQHLPTHHWKSQEIEMLVSQAYMWMELFQGAPSHLKSSPMAM